MGGGFMFAANSPTFSAAAPPFPAARSFPSPAVCTESQTCHCSENDTVFGLVPSRIEVESAILELQRFLRGLSTAKSELDSLQFHGQMYHDQMMMLQSPGFMKFSEAFVMMQAEPPLRNLVVSISCDAAVWEAILSNKAVNDMQGSISTAKEEKRLSYSKEAELAEVISRWILEFAKSKVFQLIENFASILNEIFQPAAPKEKPTSELDDLVEEKVRSSLLLSVIILLVVFLPVATTDPIIRPP